ncbi:MAG: DUF4199 domain-containing protein [Flavobacteriia bacterium]|nr:DUF4199 domain-containing protein [Flavobacteriia bacterium]
METNSPKIGKFALTYGAIAGIVSVLYSVMLMSIDMLYDQNSGQQLVGVVALVGAIFLGIFNFRKENGSLTLKQGLKIGTGGAVISGIVGVIFLVLLSNFIEPDYIANIVEIQRDAMIESNPTISNEQLDMIGEQTANFFWVGYPVILIVNALLGLVIGLVGGLIFKKDAQA